MPPRTPVYKRVLLKVSGEVLKGKRKYGIDLEATSQIAKQIKEVAELGVSIGVVIGGGNIFRGVSASAKGIDRVSADYMGMLATVVNALALQDSLEKRGLPTRVMTAIRIEQVAEPYIRRKALRHLEKGRIVIFSGGTGNPYFSTDSAAALRAIEMQAEVLLKGTKVDGIYTADPNQDRDAARYKSLSYIDFLNKGIKVMDSTAVSLCMDNHLPIIVFNLNRKGDFKRIVWGEGIGTKVNHKGKEE